MIDPTETDIGRKVIYQGMHPDDRDEGVITSFNKRFVFVRYGTSTTPVATRREDLSFSVEGNTIVQSSRRQGKTTQQILNAPHGAVFVWCNNRTDYVRDLTRSLGRTDLRIFGLDIAFESGAVRLRGINKVVVDHAAVGFMTVEQRSLYYYLSPRWQSGE